MLVNPKNMLNNALKKKYSVGAFNFMNFETLKGIIQGAIEQNTAVILQASSSTITYMGANTIVDLVKSLCEKSKIEFCLHLDHGGNYDICKQCVDAGFTSVMIDASSLDFEHNIKLTKKVVNYAHKHNVWVEAELGVLSGVEDEVSAENINYTKPSLVSEFLNKTGVDSLAISIGTSHGANKFNSEPKLRFDILNEVEQLCPNALLVLHGASSVEEKNVELFNKFGGQLSKACGVPKRFFKQIRESNICKINIDTDLRIAYLGALRKFLFQSPNIIDLKKIYASCIDAVKNEVINKIINYLN